MTEAENKAARFAFYNLLMDCLAWVDRYGSERYWPEGTVTEAMEAWNDYVVDATSMPAEEVQRRGDALYDGMCGSLAEGLYTEMWQTDKSYDRYFKQRG